MVFVKSALKLIGLHPERCVLRVVGAAHARAGTAYRGMVPVAGRAPVPCGSVVPLAVAALALSCPDLEPVGSPILLL